MGAMVNTALDMFGTPRGIDHVDCSAIVAESLQVGAGLVRDVVDVVSKVGQSLHLVNEALPGVSSTKASGQVQD